MPRTAKFDRAGKTLGLLGKAHAVRRAVVKKNDFCGDLRSNAAGPWVGSGDCLMRHPLRGGEQCNVVDIFHSRKAEEWSARKGSGRVCMADRHSRHPP